MFEFGRSIVGNAGLLMTRVEYLKSNGPRNFCIVDAAMNDLIRPSLYEAYHRIVPVTPREGDLLAVLSAGAYGMAMASNYNTRPRGAEVMVDGGTVHLVRERESVASLYALERRLPR